MNGQRLAGRFSVVYRDSKCVAVGFVGDVSAHTLTRAEIAYVQWFCNGKGKVRLERTFGKSKLPATNFNDFVLFEVED